MQATNIIITEDHIDITLNNSVERGDTLNTQYIPGTNKVQDLSGNEAAAFNLPVTIELWPNGSCTDLLLTVIDSKSIQLDWINGSTDETGISIERSLDGLTGWAEVEEIAAGLETYTNTGLSHGTLYYYRVRAVKNTYYSDYTDVESATTDVGYDVNAEVLFDRITAAGETMTDTWKDACNTAIIALKANNLFDTQFKQFVVTRGFGAAQTKMNWIAAALDFEGVNNPTRANDAGYNSDGSTSYLRTNFNPLTDGGTLYTQNDCCFIIKVAGTQTWVSGHGMLTITQNIGTQILVTSASAGANRINNSSAVSNTLKPAIGYNCLSRADSTKFTMMRNALTADTTAASVALTEAVEFYLLRRNFEIPYFTGTDEKIEFHAVGKSITQAQFLILQTIMNTFFATYQ